MCIYIFCFNTMQRVVSYHKRHSVPLLVVSSSISRTWKEVGWVGGGGLSPLSVVVTFGISRSVFETRKNTLKSLVAVHGHLKHWQSLHHVLSYSSTQALKVVFGYEIVRHFLHKEASIPLENTVLTVAANSMLREIFEMAEWSIQLG